MHEHESLDVLCGKCAWRQSFLLPQMREWLRKAGKLRADRNPEAEILLELFRAVMPQSACPQCGCQGLFITASPEDQWDDERLCEGCRRPIPRLRLEALLGVRLCAACQKAEETGQLPQAVEYCPRCGAPMAVRLSRAVGVARYVLACTGNPPCRPKNAS